MMSKIDFAASKRKYLVAAAGCVVVIAMFAYYYFFSAFSASSTTQYLYIDNDDNLDSVLVKLVPMASTHGMQGLSTLVRHSGYADHIRTGRYEIDSHIGAFALFRHLRSGMQSPVQLTIPSVRTVEDLSTALASHLMLDRQTLIATLTNPDSCAALGYTPETVVCMFVPNTYDIYWNIPLDKLLSRMKKESASFWDTDRTAKAQALHLTPIEVMTLASIVDEETANNAEKPMVAGMYYNRLMLRNAEYPTGMPLQADPTIKFALKQFALKRIYHNMLRTDSPYNTYVHTGLPPGPIRIPSVAGIDAVLNLQHHPYLYMCAKEDFSGTHNFARTYAEHQANAARYSKALNDRGIK